MFECVLHIKPFYLPVDLQHKTSVRADSSILEDIQVMWSQSYATQILRCHIYSKHSSGQYNAMPSYKIPLGRHTHSKKNRNERKQLNRKQKQRRQIERENKKAKEKVEETISAVPPPPQARWPTLKKNELDKKRKKKTRPPLLVISRVTQRTEEKISKGK